MSGSRTRLDTQLAARFAGRLRVLDGTRRRVEALVSAGDLAPAAAGHLYEGLYMGAFTAFEGFIEDLFLGLLVARGSVPRKVVPRISVQSFTIARQVVFGPARQYVDWLPFNRTTERAQVFFRGGRPFSDVPKAQVAVLNKALVIRNVIAHRSRHSLERFEAEILTHTQLSPRERSAAGFLRGLLSASPPETRYESYVSNLALVARQLST